MHISEAAEALTKKDISSSELVEAHLRHIEQTEPSLNALITVCADHAMQNARAIDERRARGDELGPLAGIPAVIKDNICTAGIRSTAASKMLHNYTPVYDATVMEKLKDAGAVVVGKANMDEFAMGSSTETSYFGTAVNPWNTDCVSGGSSGGSAAAVAAGECLYALGSDTGGSVRQPAAFCGVVGMKPTYGTVSRYGLMAFASSLDQIGPITRSVEDAAIVLEAIAGHDARDSTSATIDRPRYAAEMHRDIRGLRVGIPREYLNQAVDDHVARSYQMAIGLLEDLGAEVIETSLPTFDYALSAYYIIASAEAASNLSRFDGIRYGFRAPSYEDIHDMYRKTRTEGFGEEVKRRIMLGNYVLSAGYYDAYYLKALRVKTLIRQDFDRAFERCDLLLSPATPTAAFRQGTKATPLEMYANDLFTVPVNIAGICALSLPAAVDEAGLPIGVQLIGNAFQEDVLFRGAWNLEQAIGFSNRLPLTTADHEKTAGRTQKGVGGVV